MKAFQHIVRMCIDTERKKVLIIYDYTTEKWVSLLERALFEAGKISSKIRLDVGCCHGEEPSLSVREKMLASETIMCMAQYSLAHTAARKMTEEKGISFLSMPDYNAEMLRNPAIYVDYKSKVAQVKEYADMLSSGKSIDVISAKGTQLFMDISERKGNSCPGLTNADFLLGSPPDIEVNVAPMETKTQGKIIVDGSVTDQRIGLLQEPVQLTIVDGMIKSVFSEDRQAEKEVKKILCDVDSPKAYRIGEFGIGFNDRAVLCGNMLVDEGALGCIHFGVGSNWTIGGRNKVNFHLDFVLKDATVFIDEKIVIKEGNLLYG